jgi:outer membrane protein assembly factor BamB
MSKVIIRRYAGIITVSILIIIMVSGLAEYDFSPGILLNNAKIAAQALVAKYSFYFKHVRGKEKHEIYKDLWFKVNHTDSGVLLYDKKKAFDGLTLFTNHEARAFLIDMNGKVIHQWHKPFTEVWPEAEHVYDRVQDEMVNWHQARLLPNGDILAIYERVNQTPYGGGIIKLDKHSNLIWAVDVNAHHDLDIDQDGNIYVLKHDYNYVDELKKPIIDDGITVISPEGRVLREISFFPIFYNSKYKDMFPWQITDPFHANNLEILDAGKVQYFPMFDEGDILVSIRNANAILVLNGETYDIKWALQGLTLNQHDPDFLDDGTILVFDNYGSIDIGGGKSQILEIDPSRLALVWRYAGTPEEPFHTRTRGSQQKLPNGNILVTESNNGRIFEITGSGKIVWEYISTSLERGNIGVVCRATRHREEELSFLVGSAN